MRIALAHMRHAESGGTERYLNRLAVHLAERGDDVTVVCRSHAAPPHPAVRFAVLRRFAPGGALRRLAFARDLERHLRRERYDIVLGLGKTWTHDVVRLGGGCHATYLARAHPAARRGLERVLGLDALSQRVALGIERRALAPGAYRRVVVNAELVKRDVVERYRVPGAAVEVIYNGVDTEHFRPADAAERTAARRALGLEDAAFVVLFLGTGYGRKGLDALLSAFPALARERPEAQLAVAGYDRSQGRFERLAARTGVAGRTRFLGGRRDVARCYHAADLYVLPTRYDPFANTTLEALASGLPVITTDANGASEILRSGLEGVTLGRGAGPGALAAVLVEWSRPGRAEDARRAARALALRHGASAMLDATCRLLDRVLAEKRAGAPLPGAPARS